MSTTRPGDDPTPRAGEGGAYRKTPTQLATDPAFTSTYAPLASAPKPSGDHSGVTDLTALQAWANGLAPGSRMSIPAGNYYLNGTLTFSVDGLTIVGAGSGASNYKTSGIGTRLFFASGTADGIYVTGNGLTLEDVALVNNSPTSPTSGSGLHASTAWYTKLNRVVISGFYDDATFDASEYAVLSYCDFLDPVRYGVRTSYAVAGDTGDMVLDGCTFAIVTNTNGNAQSAFRWESGGGPRLTSCKVNGNPSTGRFAIGVDLAVAEGISTSDLIVDGCSIENCTNRGVSVTQQGPSNTGTFSNILITGTEIASGTFTDCIYIAASSGNTSIGKIVVDGCVLGNGGANSGINIQHANNIMVASNAFSGASTTSAIYISDSDTITVAPNSFTSVGGGAVKFGANCVRMQVSKQNCRGGTIINDGSLFTNTHVQQATIDTEYSREIPNVTSNSAYTTVFTWTPMTSSTAVVEIAIAGTCAGGTAGNFYIRTKWALSRPSSGAIAATVIGADETAGAGLDYTLDTATTPGQANLGVRLNAASGATSAMGSIRTKVDGRITQLQILN